MSKAVLLGLASLVFTHTAIAESLAEQQLIAKGKLHASISIGFGGIENPVAQSENFVTPLLPHIAYYGDNWYFDDFALGYSLIESDSYYLDFAGRFNQDGFYFELDGVSKLFATFSPVNGGNKGGPIIQYPEYLLTPIERDLSYLGGLVSGLKVYDSTWLELAALQDVTGVHEGHELQFNAYHVTEFNGGELGLGFGVEYKSQKLIEYYYRVREGEANTRLPHYELDNSLNYHASVHYKHPLSELWSIDINIKHTWVDTDLYHTPMLGKHTFFTGFAGITYQF